MSFKGPLKDLLKGLLKDCLKGFLFFFKAFSISFFKCVFKGMGRIYGNTGDRFNTITGLMLDTPGAGTFHYSLVHKEYSGSGIFNHSNPTSSIVLLEISA